MNWRCSAARRFEAGAEGGEAAVDADLRPADRRLERQRGKGSAPEPASAPNSTALSALPVASASAGHVERDQPPCGVAAGAEQRRRIDPAVGERDLLGHGEDTMGGSDEQRRGPA